MSPRVLQPPSIVKLRNLGTSKLDLPQRQGNATLINMKAQHLLIRAAAIATTFMIAGLAFAATPYEVVGPSAPKPHEQTAMNELSAYLERRVADKLRVGGKEGVVFRVGDTDLARREGLLSSQLPS